MTTIKETLPIIQEYVYAGAVRHSVGEAVVLLREHVAKAAGPEAVAFLRTPAGEALLRLALGGILSAIPADKRPQPLTDARDECLVSCTASGFAAVQAAVTEIVTLLMQERT